MSSYASLYIRGVEAFEWRNEVAPTFLFLFSVRDIRRGRVASGEAGLPAAVLDERDEYEQDTHALTATAGVVLDRLDALGVSSEDTQALFYELRDREVGILRSIRSDVTDAGFGQAISDLEAYNYDDWLRDISRAPPASDRGVDTPFKRMRSELDGQDARYAIRAYLDGIGRAETVTLDVTDLVEGGWVPEDLDPHEVAAKHYQFHMSVGSPAIIITEGSTDARFLADAIKVLRPHLVGYINFLDYSVGNEGSAGAAVKTFKSFIAAGITNRVILLLDNDSAGRDAARSLRGASLPRHFVATHYPDTDHGRRYPTLGPTGLAAMDVNGLAGSIELYLGRDVLTDADGHLVTVQWAGYVRGVEAYQGELMGKGGIHARYAAKVKAALENNGPLPNQDWDDLDSLLASLLEVLAKLG